jgi:hypothetical protein
MRRVQRKAWELLAKTESEGDHRGSIVALREVREFRRTRSVAWNRSARYWRRRTKSTATKQKKSISMTLAYSVTMNSGRLRLFSQRPHAAHLINLKPFR